MDAAMGQVPASHHPGGGHGQWIHCKMQHTCKKHVLATLCEIRTPRWTLYSGPKYNKLLNILTCHNWSCKAQLHFWLSNIGRGQKLANLWCVHKAPQKHAGACVLQLRYQWNLHPKALPVSLSSHFGYVNIDRYCKWKIDCKLVCFFANREGLILPSSIHNNFLFKSNSAAVPLIWNNRVGQL